MKSLGKVQTIVDLGGGGIDSILCNILSPYAERVLVVDQGGAGKSRGNIHELVADFEDGVYEIPNDSVEIIVSASSIEHLTKLGQELIFSEIQRILMPGGVFCGTISYVTRLDARALALIKSDPAFEAVGSPHHCAFNARDCLNHTKGLTPVFPPTCWSMFPGFDGFSEGLLLNNQALLFDHIRSYGNVKILPEIDALRLRWYEMGLFLYKTSSR